MFETKKLSTYMNYVLKESITKNLIQKQVLDQFLKWLLLSSKIELQFNEYSGTFYNKMI